MELNTVVFGKILFQRQSSRTARGRAIQNIEQRHTYGINQQNPRMVNFDNGAVNLRIIGAGSFIGMKSKLVGAINQDSAITFHIECFPVPDRYKIDSVRLYVKVNRHIRDQIVILIVFVLAF